MKLTRDGMAICNKFKPFILIIFVSGCSLTDLKNSYNASIDYVNIDRIVITEDVTLSPYSLDIVQINNNDELLAILSSNYGDMNNWSLPNNVKYSSLDGKIIETSGLDFDFKITNFSGLKISGTSSAYLYFKKPSSGTLEIFFNYKIIKKGIMKKKINNEEFNFLLLEEKFNVPLIGWSGLNYYWIDEFGVTWKSNQHIDPFKGNLKTLSLKK
tara:strand:+ start:5408 stop:6046 length:639 start_codon:yes stop_codon:yes gene_type:complete